MNKAQLAEWRKAQKAEYDRQWREANREWQKQYDRRLTPEQKAAHLAARKERFRKFKENFVGPKLPGRRFFRKSKGTPESRKAAEKKRAAAKANRTPLWFGEFDSLVMTEANHLLGLRRAATGIDWHIDHMIPLRAKTVSGLHVGNNIAVIPGGMNSAKRERLIYTETGDWLRNVA